MFFRLGQGGIVVLLLPVVTAAACHSLACLHPRALCLSLSDPGCCKTRKPIRKADRAAAKADRAQAKIPKKQVRQKTVDPKTGKVTTKLVLEDKKKPPSKLSHAVRDAPGDAALGKLHKEIRETEQDNVGVESAHKSEETAETGVRLVREGYRSHKLKPYRKAAQAEQKLEKANVNALYQKSLRENPQLTSNPFSRWQQKQAIKREYAAAKAGKSAGNTVKASEATAKAARKAAENTKKTGEFIARHKKGFLIVGGIAAMLVLILCTVSSCSMLIQGGATGVNVSTYPSEDADMLAAEAAYCAMEAELQQYLDTYESTHDYDEYHFDLDDIEHDPYVLISAVTALMGREWTLSEVGGILDMLFEKQYILTETVTTETRYRSETRTGYYTDAEGNLHSYEYTVQVPYTYYICTVKLENFNLSHVPVYIMSQDQLSLYAMYMATLGNRPDLFCGSEYIGKYYTADYEKYEIPPEALEDEQFAAIIMEAEHEADPEAMFDIVTLNSKSGLEGSNKNFAYAGSKFGGIGLTQSFALELCAYNIKVNAVCPGNFLDGPLWSDPVRGLFVQYLEAGKVPGAKTVADVRRYYEAKVPMNRGCLPVDVARAVMYCVEQKYETGQAIPVTGGQVMLN